MTRTRGPGWKLAHALEEQEDWVGHAKFMNGLHAEGFVLLGGPLENTRDVLLVIRVESAEEIRTCLAADSWSHNGLLRITRIVPWTLHLGKIE